MLLSNLHTHTVFSDGENTVEENIAKAVEKGFVSIGISDHSHTDFDLSYCMNKEKLPEYKSEISKQKEKWRGTIEVYMGIELDGFSDFFEKEDYDYVIGSCHYVEKNGIYYSVDHCVEIHKDIIEKVFENSPLKFARAYYNTVAERISCMRPDIIGHFDLVAKFNLMPEEECAYQRLAVEALDACLEITPIIEMNTGAMARGLRSIPYLAPFLLDRIKERGGMITLSSDSHNAKNLDAAFEECKTILKEKGFKSVVVMKNGKFTETEI